MYLFCRTQRKIFWRKFVTGCFGAPLTSIVRKKYYVNGAPELLCFPHSSEYLPLCSAEQIHSYRFGTTWGWANDDRIFIFGWTIPLSTHSTCLNDKSTGHLLDFILGSSFSTIFVQNGAAVQLERDICALTCYLGNVDQYRAHYCSK